MTDLISITIESAKSKYPCCCIPEWYGLPFPEFIEQITNQSVKGATMRALPSRLTSVALISTATFLFACVVTVSVPTTAQAKPEFAAQTGLPCGQCHVNQAGGGQLKSFGEKFKANGYKVKK